MYEPVEDLEGYFNDHIEFWDNIDDKAFQNLENAREPLLKHKHSKDNNNITYPNLIEITYDFIAYDIKFKSYITYTLAIHVSIPSQVSTCITQDYIILFIFVLSHLILLIPYHCQIFTQPTLLNFIEPITIYGNDPLSTKRNGIK